MTDSRTATNKILALRNPFFRGFVKDRCEAFPDILSFCHFLSMEKIEKD
jgi:hypothetical protein